jgi:L-alanine-DL-glutamate epimerase-like enolase superfamily enzyme
MELIQDIRYRRIRRSLRTRFVTALGGKSFLDSVLVRITLKNGARGDGEVPTSFAVPRESIPAIGEGIRSARRLLEHTDIEEYPDRLDEFRRLRPDLPMTAAGIETALFRAALHARGISEHAFWGGRSAVIQTDITVPYSPEREELSRWLRSVLRKGFAIFKLKISGNPERDLAYLELVYSLLGEAGRPFTVRLDGNQSYGAESFLKWIERCRKKGFTPELVEQPLPAGDLEASAFVRKRAGIPIILDESIFRLDDLERAVGTGSCDGVNIKIAKSGINEAKRLLDAARSAGLKTMLGCMMETMTGLSAAVFMAAGTAEFDYLDLDSVHFLSRPGSCGGIRTTGFRYEIGER